jgi:DHA2 family multidrug resistance protein-like MFS transporter
MDATVTNTADGLPTAVRSRAMVALSIAMGLAVLDSVVANIALPSIATELAITPAQSIWVVNSYQVAMTVSLLPFSSLGDIRGYRFVYLLGLAVFTLASLACGLAESLPMLVAARLVQGIGAVGITSVNMALVRYIYPRARLGQGMGIIGLVVAAAAAAGPSVAAAILSVATWQYLFLLNVPLGGLALVMALRSVLQTQGAGHRFDFTGATLNAAGFVLMFLGAANGLGHGDNPDPSLAELAAGMVIFGVFVRLQMSVAAPMLPVDLLMLPAFAMSAVTSVCAYVCQTLAFLALPFYFLYVGGRSQIETGLLLTPWPAALIVVAPLAGRLADRYPAGLLCGAGLAALTVGMLLLLRVPAEAGLTDVIWPMLISGTGFVMFQSPNNRAFMASAPHERSGACAGMMTTSRLVGQTLSGLIVALVFALAGAGKAAIASGAIATLTIGAVFAAAAMGVSFWRLCAPQR